MTTVQDWRPSKSGTVPSDRNDPCDRNEMRILHGLVLISVGGPITGLVRSPCVNSIRWMSSHHRHANHVVKRPPDIAAPAAATCHEATVRRKRTLRLTSGDQEAVQAAPPSSAPAPELSLPENLPTLTPTPALSLGSMSSSAATGGPEKNRLDDDVPVEVVSPLSSTSSEAASALLPLALLNAVTVLWGTQHAIIKLILQGDLSPGVTNFARFSVAAVLFSPWTPGLLRDVPPLPFSSSAAPHDSKTNMAEESQDSEEAQDADAVETWRAGAELGLWMFLGFAFQAIGLGFTTASRSAFLLYLNVKLVPFFAFVLEGRIISIATWLSAFLAFVGTVLLSSDGTPPNIGDLWSVMAAATSAMFILRLERYSGSCDASRLNSANLWITAGLCGLWAAWEVTSGRVDPGAAIDGVRSQAPLIGYLAVVTTALTNWMQALGQRSVPAEKAAVIYAMDPVYAAGFAYLLLGETLGPAGILGASIITGAALWSQGQQRLETEREGMETTDEQSLTGGKPDESRKRVPYVDSGSNNSVV